MSTTDDAVAEGAEDFTPKRATSYRELETEDGPGQELVERPAYTQFSQEKIALIGKSIMPAKYRPEELYHVLEVAAMYKLDPLTKEIWAIRMSENQNEPVTIMVGVEGMKAIARRQPDFRGFRVGEVFENDTFEFSSTPTKLPDGTWTHFTHSFSGFGVKDRGALVGAYAEVYRKDAPTVWFVAPLEEYIRSGGRTPWNKQKTAMIRKCALANGLRLAFPVSGVYVEEEIAGARMRDGAPIRQGEVASTVEDEYGWDDEWREQRAADLFAALEKVKPGEYLPGRRRLMVTNAATDDQRDELLASLEVELVDAGGEVPPPPESQVGEVVEDDPYASAGDDLPFGTEAEIVMDAEVEEGDGQERLV